MPFFRVIIAILFIGGGIGILQGFLRPKWDEVGVVREKIATVEDAIIKTNEVINLRDELVNKYNNVSQADIERVRAFLPGESEVGEMLITVDQLAKDTGVKLTSLGFQEQAGAPAPVSDIDVLALSLNISGTYEQFLSFLDALERHLRLIDAVTVSFSAGDTNTYDVKLQVRTYYQRKTIF